MKIYKIIGFTAIFLSLFASSLLAQESKKNYNFASFDEIEVSGALNVHLEQGLTESVRVETFNFNIDKVHIEATGGKLKIYTKKNKRKKAKQKIDVYVTCLNLTKLKVEGASNFFANKGFFKSEKLEISAQGASEIEILVELVELKLKASGASDIKIVGNADKQDITASGASEINAYDLLGKTVHVKASGASNIDVQASDRLKAKATGASSIRYKGNPVKVSTDSSGASSINKR